MDDSKNLLWKCGGSLCAILFAGNIFFVSRLVDKLEKTSDIVWQLRQDIVVLNLTVENLKKRLRKGE